jgi:hypothetical protein
MLGTSVGSSYWRGTVWREMLSKMPAPTIHIISDVLPYEMNGRVSPVNGSSDVVTAILIRA